MYFEIVRAAGGYRVHIRGGNHEKIFTSEVYVAKSSAHHAIGVVKAHAATAQTVDRTT